MQSLEISFPQNNSITPFQPLLPYETARSTVWHQVQCPWEFNRHQRTVVNYANHWALLSATVQHRNPAASNIRIGSLVRNKITQLLLDLDYCSSSGSDGGMPQGFQNPLRYDSPVQDPFEQEEELTDRFVARSVAANMQASSVEFHPEGSRCSCCYNCGHRSNCKISSSAKRNAKHSVQQFIVMGQGTNRGRCQVQINDFTACGCCQARM